MITLHFSKTDFSHNVKLLSENLYPNDEPRILLAVLQAGSKELILYAKPGKFVTLQALDYVNYGNEDSFIIRDFVREQLQQIFAPLIDEIDEHEAIKFLFQKKEVSVTLFHKEDLQELVNIIWEDREKLTESYSKEVIEAVVNLVDQGYLRTAEPTENGWKVNEWVKKAVVLYFPTNDMKTTEVGPFEFHDKIPLKTGYKEKGVRIVPHAIARYGAYISKGVIMMPSYVNIGAYVDEGTMVDTWATVGSCAQIGKNVHLSGGVGIGGVLEPLQASPVIIEDNAFIGSRAIIVEGVHVEKGAVIGANVVITASTKIIDVTGDEPVEMKGKVPTRSVVIPGTYTKSFSAGNYQVPCALIIGKRKKSTDMKTSLNDALRDYNVAV